MTQAHPLAWPAGRPRTKRAELARFGTSRARARDGLMNELRLLAAKQIVLSTNVPLRRDGLPYASLREPDDTGVAVYFLWKGRQKCFTCDRWDKVQDNLQAVRLTIAAFRGLDRWGTGDMVEAAFVGFDALPAPAGTMWHEILGVSVEATRDEIELAFRRKASEAHPDTGGSHAAMTAVNEARKVGLRALGSSGDG